MIKFCKFCTIYLLIFDQCVSRFGLLSDILEAKPMPVAAPDWLTYLHDFKMILLFYFTYSIFISPVCPVVEFILAENIQLFKELLRQVDFSYTVLVKDWY